MSTSKARTAATKQRPAQAQPAHVEGQSQEQLAQAQPEVVLVQSCPSISGKSTLTYHVGLLGEEIQLRVYANSGGGLFSNEWIGLNAIVDELPSSAPFTSRNLHTLVKGKSINTPGFLLAVLKHAGLAQASASKRRCWERGDVDGFRDKVAELIASKDAKATANPPSSSKVRPKKGKGATPS